MKTNMGKLDRFVRILIAVVIALLYSSKIITGVLAITLVIVAIIFVVTSMIGTCPLYSLLRISSKKKNTGAL
jgi:hypothetical protein